jgi:hypothetical protein
MRTPTPTARPRLGKGRPPARPDRRRGGRGYSERRKVCDGADLVHARDHIVGHRRELTARGLVTLALEQLVGDPHLDVVRLTGDSTI